MFLPLAVIIAGIVFAVQLMLCLKGKKRLGKLLPLFLIGVGEVVCWSVVLLEQFCPFPYGAAFAAYIYAIILLIFLGADILAWVIWAVLKTVRDRKNNF